MGEGLAVGVLHRRLIQRQRLRFELPKVADKVRLDTPLNHSAVAFGFLAVDAGAAAALCGTNGWSIGALIFEYLHDLFARSAIRVALVVHTPLKGCVSTLGAEHFAQAWPFVSVVSPQAVSARATMTSDLVWNSA